MNSGDWNLILVVAAAFIAGYSIISFIIKKVKLRQHLANPSAGQAGQSQHEDAKYKGATQGSGRFDTNYDGESQEHRYASVLGLGANVAAEDVKQAYRELLAKYHPDKVSHLGDEFKRIAEARTKDIIEAYGYFREKYKIR